MGRPAPRFHDFIGHRTLIDPIRRELEGATERGEPLPHLMLTGPSGVGKTRLAEALAREAGTRLLRVMGNAPRSTLVKKLLALKHGDFLFIDEGHGLKPPEQDMLLDVIDRLRVRRPADNDAIRGSKKPAAAKSKMRRVQPFTLVIATDRPGELGDALQKRFPNRLHLMPYPLSEVREILATVASELEVLMSPQAAHRLAEACHVLPRRAKHLLQKLRLFIRPGVDQVSVRMVEDFLAANHIDANGLGPVERKYIQFLSERGHASLDTLAQYLGTDRDEVLRQIEPTLVRMGLVAISPSGRCLTPKGRPTRVPRDEEE